MLHLRAPCHGILLNCNNLFVQEVLILFLRGSQLTRFSRLREEFSFIRGNVLVLASTWIFVNLIAAIPLTYYPKYVEGLGGTPFIVGVIGFASFAILALVQFPGGYLADRHGRKWLTVAMTFGVAATYTFYVFAPSWQFIFVGAILLSLCSIYQPAIVALMADSIPPEKRGIGYSVFTLTAYASVPSPIIAGLLSIRYGLIFGMRIAYSIVAISFVAAAFMRIKIKETLENEKEKMSLQEALRTFPNSVKESLKALTNAPRSMFFLFFSFAIFNFAWYLGYLNMIFYATEVLHIKEFEWAILMTWFSAVSFLSALPCGSIIDKIGRKKPLWVAWLLFMPSMIIFLVGNIILLYVCFLLLGLASTILFTVYPALQADLVARENRGKIAGSTFFFFYILNSLGQLFGGFIYQYVSAMLPFLLSAMLYIPCFLLTLFLVHEPTKKET